MEGEKLYMTVLTSRDLHLYVVSEDGTGPRLMIHPCHNWGRSRPCRAGRLCRLPSSVLGQDTFWPVGVATRRERLLVIGSEQPIDALEAAVLAGNGSRPCAVSLASDLSRRVDRLMAGGVKKSVQHSLATGNGSQDVWLSTYELEGRASHGRQE